MQRVILQVPMSKELKEKAENASSSLGFSSLQEAIRVLLTKFSKREFHLKVEEQPSKYLLSAMKRAKKNRLAGKGSPVFDNIKDNLKYLNEQGI